MPEKTKSITSLIATKGFMKIMLPKVGTVVSSSVFAEMVTFPADTVKARIQIQGQRPPKICPQKTIIGPINIQNTKKYKNRSIIKTAKYIKKRQGMQGFYSGLTPALLRHAIYSGIRVPLYEYSRDKLIASKNKKVAASAYSQSDPNKLPETLSVFEAALVAGSCGLLGQFIVTPVDFLKVKLQTSDKSTSMKKVWTKMPKGIKGYWTGATPGLSRAILVNQGDLMAYDRLKSFLLRNGHLEESAFLHFVCALGSASASCVLATPCDTVKTRLMYQPLNKKGKGLYYKNIWDCVKQIAQKEGIPRFWKGFFPAWIRMAIWSQIFWHSNEIIRAYFGLKPF